MMIMKFVGAITVLISCTLIGFLQGRKSHFRMNDLLELKKALVILKSEIIYIKNPLSEALENVSFKIKEPLSSVFAQVAQTIGERIVSDVSTVWKEVSLNQLSNTCLIKEDLDAILQFGDCLGHLDKEMQLSNIELMIQYIDAKVNILNVESAQNSKMFNSLGILCGILFCVVLF